MASRSKLAIVISAAFLALAAQPPAESDQPPGRMSMQGMPGMSMQGMHRMMQECRNQCEETLAAMDKLNKQIEEAKKADDPAKLKETLDQAQKSLQALRGRMDTCLKMMAKMDSSSSSSAAGSCPPNWFS